MRRRGHAAQDGEVAPGEPLLSEPLPEAVAVSDATRQHTRMATFDFKVTPRGAGAAQAFRFIKGSAPIREDPLFGKMCSLYSRERALYPQAFFDAIRLSRSFCENSLMTSRRVAMCPICSLGSSSIRPTRMRAAQDTPSTTSFGISLTLRSEAAAI